MSGNKTITYDASPAEMGRALEAVVAGDHLDIYENLGDDKPKAVMIPWADYVALCGTGGYEIAADRSEATTEAGIQHDGQ